MPAAAHTHAGARRRAHVPQCVRAVPRRSPHDPYVIGGVVGSRYLLWDLRIGGNSRPPQHAGDSHPGGCTSCRFAPGSAHLATSGASGEAYVHALAPAESAPLGGWSSAPTKLGHELPTRVSGLEWLHVGAPTLLGGADRKVAAWVVPPEGAGAQPLMPGAGGAADLAMPRPMALL